MSTLYIEEVVQKYNKYELLEFLRKEMNSWELGEDDLEIICREKINGHNFLILTEDKLVHHGMKLGPAMTLVELAKSYKVQRSISSRNSKFSFTY